MAKKQADTRRKSGTIIEQFEVVSGKVQITDPGYDKTIWCAATIENVKNGKWNAYANQKDAGDGWGTRCTELMVWHSDYQQKVVSLMKALLVTEEIGVDSGQAGVFDSKFFKDDKSVEGVERQRNGEVICEDEPFYSMCCDRTLSETGWGTIPYGAVSSSGYGDGGYRAFVFRDTYSPGGPVVGIKIVFIDETEEEEEVA